MGAIKQSLIKLKTEKKLPDSNLLLGRLNSLQQIVDGYATNVAFTPDKAMHEVKGFTEQNKILKQNANNVKDSVNPAINNIIFTIERSFIVVHDKGHHLLDDLIGSLDSEEGRTKFKTVSNLFEKKIQSVIDTLDKATPIANTARAKIEENARISGKIVNDANNSKSGYKAELIELNEKIKNYEKTVTDAKDTLIILEKTEKSALLGVAISAAFGLISFLLFGIPSALELSKARREIVEQNNILNEAQNKLKNCKIRMDEVNRLLAIINSIYSIMKKINTDSISLAKELLSIRESWDSLKNLLATITTEMNQITSIDEEDLAALKEIYIDPLKEYVKQLKETINIRNQKMNGSEFKIDIDPNLSNKLSYFPKEFNGFITMPSNLAYSLYTKK